MKVIKKLVSVLMVGVLTLSVMACSGTDKNKTARELDIETPVTAVSYTHLTLPTICSV